MDGIRWQQPEFWYLVVLLVVLLASIGWRIPKSADWRRGFRWIIAWGGIVGVIAVVYVLRHELSEVPERLAAEFLGAEGASDDQTMRYRLDQNGHALITANINDQPVTFLLDTGASQVVIGSRDAAKLGLVVDPDRAISVNTANGTATMYRQRLSSLKIGSKMLYDIPALLNPLPDSVSLLGMTALSHLKISISGDYVVIR